VKKIIIIVAASIIGLIFSAWLFRTIYNKIELKKEKAVTYILSDSDKALIQDGDVILRYGHGFVSDYIVNTFKEEFNISHCGIVKRTDDKLEVIHSESSSFLSKEGIQKQDFDSFTDAGHKNSVIIVRFNQCEPESLKKITRIAEYYLKKEIPFDYAFDHTDTSVMYCSEIIWHIFLDAFSRDIFLVDGKPKFDQFKNFWDPKNFDIILNHQINGLPK
jgi:uncharacterized protein YycO